jgi:Leishmanolysin
MSSKSLNATQDPTADADFIDANLRPLKMGQIVESFVSARGRTRARVITPTVREAVKEHFACSSLAGALLEDDFGNGLATSHWDQRLFEGDLMDPVAGQNTVGGRHVISNTTLALLQDTGWYAHQHHPWKQLLARSQSACLPEWHHQHASSACIISMHHQHASSACIISMHHQHASTAECDAGIL